MTGGKINCAGKSHNSTHFLLTQHPSVEEVRYLVTRCPETKIFNFMFIRVYGCFGYMLEVKLAIN